MPQKHSTKRDHQNPSKTLSEINKMDPESQRYSPRDNTTAAGSKINPVPKQEINLKDKTPSCLAQLSKKEPIKTHNSNTTLRQMIITNDSLDIKKQKILQLSHLITSFAKEAVFKCSVFGACACFQTLSPTIKTIKRTKKERIANSQSMILIKYKEVSSSRVHNMKALSNTREMYPYTKVHQFPKKLAKVFRICQDKLNSRKQKIT